MTAQIDAARIAAIGIANHRETFSVFAEDDPALRPGMVWLNDRARPYQSAQGPPGVSERYDAAMTSCRETQHALPSLSRSLLWSLSGT